MVKNSNLEKKIEVPEHGQAQESLGEPSLTDVKSCQKTRSVVRKVHKKGIFKLLESLHGMQD